MLTDMVKLFELMLFAMVVQVLLMTGILAILWIKGDDGKQDK